ncbi:hypothetical protein ACTXM3_15980 [Glutamicibacter arilaitensis]|uniref:hypothetical protein n=1 Tax=Glutamicibacter arilaitensis TaxID=256701 RepID=UPI003FD515EC
MRSHSFYKVPIRQLAAFDSFEPTLGDTETIYTLGIGDKMELGAYVGFSKSKSDVLRIGFHAAKNPKEIRDHKFTPIDMSRKSGDSFILFWDPTLVLSDTALLCWYLGTPDVNPDDWMELFVRRMMQACHAKYLVVEGSSGGGFTSMRFASRFSNAVAVPKIPQTDLFRYKSGPLAIALRDSGWESWTYERILNECPERFRIADVYNDTSWNRGNLVQYVQNVGDTTHVEDHLKPFLREVGAPHDNAHSVLNDQFMISRPYTGTGHIAVPPEYWQAENTVAINRLRRDRAKVEIEQPWKRPSTRNISEDLFAARTENLSQHRDGNKIW